MEPSAATYATRVLWMGSRSAFSHVSHLFQSGAVVRFGPRAAFYYSNPCKSVKQIGHPEWSGRITQEPVLTVSCRLSARLALQAVAVRV